MSPTLLSFTAGEWAGRAINRAGPFVVSNAGATENSAEEQCSLGPDRHGNSRRVRNRSGRHHHSQRNRFSTDRDQPLQPAGHRRENLGGLKPGGAPQIPLTFVSQNQFTFARPAAAMAGAATCRHSIRHRAVHQFG
jgi:hypothetical protein